MSPELINNGFPGGKSKKVPDGFKFSSDNNALWHTDESFINTLKVNGIIS